MRRLCHLGWLLAAVLLVSCTRGAAPRQSGARTFTDPFAYCADVGTIDAPDARYVGPPVPTAIAAGLRGAFGLPETASLEPFRSGTYWRCMGGKVFACNVGANIPCLDRADMSRTPNPGMSQYCRENPDAEFIPAYVTGRATVYAWRCVQGLAQVTVRVAWPDARGFLANFWHPITPPGD